MENQQNRPRVALYSHDAQGLGHVRRNLAIAHALSASQPAPDVLLLTGAPEAVTANRPAGCDLVSLPAMAKDPAGLYAARHLSVDDHDIVAMRSAILTAALTSFAPDVLIVDKHPRGLLGELEPALQKLSKTGTSIILGLRDVLDTPEVARREWNQARCAAALSRWYDGVWVYGDPNTFDPVADLNLPATIAGHVTYTGYLAHGREGTAAQPTPVDKPYVLGVVGGGSDGAALAENFVSADLPAGYSGVLVTGPEMPRADQDRIRAIAAARSGIRIYDYVEDVPEMLGAASAVVAMGGYNTVCETLAVGTPLLILPRTHPRQEQLVRAEALQRLGIAEVLLPRDLTAGAITTWLATAVTRPSTIPGGIDLDGLGRLPALLNDVITTKEVSHVA